MTVMLLDSHLAPNPENIKIRARSGKCVYDSKRKVYRISKGAILEAQPTKGSGYNQTNVSQPFYGEGRWSFVMERRQKNGELQARSSQIKRKETEAAFYIGFLCLQCRKCAG